MRPPARDARSRPRALVRRQVQSRTAQRNCSDRVLINNDSHSSPLRPLPCFFKVAAGIVPDLLDNFTRTKEHLSGLVDLLDAGLHRSFVVLERMAIRPTTRRPMARTC